MEKKSTFLHSLICSRKGFSLAEVLVAAGLFGGLSLAIMHFMQSSTQSSNTIMASMEVTQLHNQVLLHLRNYDNCYQTFRDHYFGDDNIPLARALKDGKKDNTFKGLTGEKAPVKLIGIKLYGHDEKLPDVANKDSSVVVQDQHGWTIVAEFKYEKYKSISGAPKIFGGSSVSKFELLKFDNFFINTLISDSATCTAHPFNFVGPGREYQLDDGTIIFIAPCLQGDPKKVAIKNCVL
ncbi:MAG: hypothetical protein HYV97_09030 [Bdellovibrio sp.]|nr:hypothetical protein [Bdellovibrio sp.]